MTGPSDQTRRSVFCRHVAVLAVLSKKTTTEHQRTSQTYIRPSGQRLLFREPWLCALEHHNFGHFHTVIILWVQIKSMCHRYQYFQYLSINCQYVYVHVTFEVDRLARNLGIAWCPILLCNILYITKYGLNKLLSGLQNQNNVNKTQLIIILIIGITGVLVQLCVLFNAKQHTRTDCCIASVSSDCQIVRIQC